MGMNVNAMIFSNPYLSLHLPHMGGDTQGIQTTTSVAPVVGSSGARGADTSTSHERQSGNGSLAAVLFALTRNTPDATSKSVVEAQASHSADTAIAFLEDVETAAEQVATLAAPVGLRDLDLPDPMPTADILLSRD